MPHTRHQSANSNANGSTNGNTCSHCTSKKSPLWRRGMHSELLCNACGLYWKHHGVYRPINKINGNLDTNTNLNGNSAINVTTFATGTINGDRSRSSDPLPHSLISSSSLKKLESTRSSSARSADEVLLFPKKEFMHKAALKDSLMGSSYRSSASFSSSVSPIPSPSLEMLSVKSNLKSKNHDENAINSNTGNIINHTNISKVKLTLNTMNTGTASTGTINGIGIGAIGNLTADHHVANEEIKRLHHIRPNMENKKGMPQKLYPAKISHSHSPPSPTVVAMGATAALEMKSNEHYDVEGVKYIMLRHKMLYQEDYVAIRGSDNQIYFAIVRDFWFTPEGRKLFTLQWLLPRPDQIMNIDMAGLNRMLPSHFILGPDHDRPEPLEAIIDIFYSPSRELRNKESPLRSEDLEIAQLLCSLA